MSSATKKLIMHCSTVMYRQGSSQFLSSFQTLAKTTFQTLSSFRNTIGEGANKISPVIVSAKENRQSLFEGFLDLKSNEVYDKTVITYPGLNT